MNCGSKDIFKNAPCHRDLVNYGMVKNTKTWISWERKETFLRNKKILNLCLIWHSLRCCRFAAEVTFKMWRQILNLSNQVIVQRERQYLLYNQRKFTFALLRVFNIFCSFQNLASFITRSVPQRNVACKKNISFTIESLALQNRHLSGTYSISDFKLLWIYGASRSIV